MSKHLTVMFLQLFNISEIDWKTCTRNIFCCHMRMRSVDERLIPCHGSRVSLGGVISLLQASANYRKSDAVVLIIYQYSSKQERIFLYFP